MKRVFIVVAIVVTVVGAVLNACKKEKELMQNGSEQVAMNDPQMSDEVKRIVSFKQQVDARKANPGMKSGETLTLEEAMNSVVDLFNATYTEPMAYYTESERHNFTINVALTADGEVLMDDAVAAYEQALAQARQAYHASPLPTKAYRRLMATCQPQRDGSVELQFDGMYGTKTDQPQPPTPHIDGPFKEGDDWRYKDGMGSCDGVLSGGADKVLEDTIMKEVRSLWPIDPTNCRGLYTDYETHEISPLFGYTGIFYSINSDDTCIEWQYMNDYLNGEKWNIYQVVPQRYGINLNGNSMQPYKYFVTNVVIEGQGNEQTGPIYHWTEVEYARYYYIENNGTIVPLEL